MNDFWRRLDPRRHLAAAIGWTVFGIVSAFALGSAALAAQAAQSRARADTERMLTRLAAQIGRSVALELRTRRSILQAAAARFDAQASGDSPALLQQRLEALQRQFPEFEWLGVVDTQAQVVAAVGEPRPGAQLMPQPWLRQTAEAPHGDEGSGFFVAPAPELAAASAAGVVPLRALATAAPLHDATGRVSGVLAGRLSWNWIERLAVVLLDSIDGRWRLQVLLAAPDGQVWIGPARWLGRDLGLLGDLSEGGRFVVGRVAAQRLTEADGPGWTVVAQQEADAVLAPARAAGRTVFLGVLGAGVLSAAIAAALVQLLLRRLARLAREAQALQGGVAQSLPVPRGRDEVSRIAATLADVLRRLQREKSALLELNSELDRRVAERTERIERLADEARQAAVTRERLRLARDLHDTLAHSLMALLTQLRLVRKLRARWSDARLEDELGCAEAAAVGGLAEARAAIGQMRHNGIREAGLGAALSELLDRMRARCGVAAALRIEPDVAQLAGERAETAFRIVEEALRNVEQHAHAHEVELLLARLPASADSGDSGDAAQRLRVRLEVRDDGVGFDPARNVSGHYGLRGMREQAALLDAKLEIASRAGHGTRVALEFTA